MSNRTRLFVALATSLCGFCVQSETIFDLMIADHGLSSSCGSRLLPIDISVDTPSLRMSQVILNGYGTNDCSGESVYSGTWTTPSPGALMSSKTYYLCSNSLLAPTHSACVPGLQSMSFQTVSQAGYKTPLSCQQVTCSNDIFTPTGPAWSNSPSTPQGRVIGYLTGWTTPLPANEIADAGYTHVLLAFGLFSTSTPGGINIQALSGIPNLASYIDDLHQHGVKVLLSMGGASTSIAGTTVDFDAAVAGAINPGEFQTIFVNNMVTLVDTYGFDGYDFDIEHGLNPASSFVNPGAGCSNSSHQSTCDIFYLSNIIKAYKARKPSSMITFAPEIPGIAVINVFTGPWSNYASLIMQVRPLLEWVGFQNYNSGCAYGLNAICYPQSGTLTSSPDPAVAFSADLLNNWPVPYNPYVSMLSPSQVVVGYVVPNASNQCDGAPCVILSAAKQVFKCLTTQNGCDTYTAPAAYPGFGGTFAWTINNDASNSYQFATTLAPCVKLGQCN